MPVWEGRAPGILHPSVDRRGQLFVGTNRGMFRLIEETDTFERIAAGYTWGISEDASGGVWITDIVAGFRRLAEPPSPPRPLEGAGYRLMHDRQGNLWVATLGEGLWRVRDASAATPADRTHGAAHRPVQRRGPIGPRRSRRQHLGRHDGRPAPVHTAETDAD